MILLKALLNEVLRDNGISASIEPFRAVAEWDSAYQRFVFEGGVWAKLRVKPLSNTLKAKMKWQFVRAGESIDQPIEVVELVSIHTPPKAQGQGLARAALSEITKVADSHNMWMTLEAIPFGNDRGMNTWQLVEFYKSTGFQVVSYGARPLMLRKPITADFSGQEDTV
jgi:GNAT superfamily N-acetyltransferase